VRAIHFILRASLDRAVRWRYLAVNQAAIAGPPPFERPEPDPPSTDEVAALLNDEWRDLMWGMLLWLTMVTGRRRGEVRALRWTDLDLARGVMTIERSYAQTAKGTEEKATKSHQKRRVALDGETVTLLSAYRGKCEAECRLLDSRLPRDTFVFSYSPDGSIPLLPSSVTQRYRRLAARAGLRSTRIHALRHYSATELLNAGVNIRTVAGRLNHGAGGATTLRFYSAWVDEADRRAADAIAGIMPRPDPTRRETRTPYERVAAALRAQIESGHLAVGAALPTRRS
jgi:integrase